MTKKALSPQQKTENSSALEADQDHLIDYLLKQEIISKESLGLTPEAAQNIYEQAYQFYSAGQFPKAKSLFSILLIFNPAEFQFHYGYATCCLMQKEYEAAAASFVLSGQLDPSNPLPYFYAADCYIQMRDLLSTCSALEIAVKKSGDHPEYAEIKQRAQLTLDALTAKT